MARIEGPARQSLTPLMVSALSALLLGLALPAEARGVWGALRTCERQDPRRLERAIEACTRVIEREDRASVHELERALAARANMRAGRNDLEGAAGDLQHAIRLGADEAAIFLALGAVKASLNDPEAALASFARVIETNAPQASAARIDALTHSGAIELERGRWSEATSFYARALASAPSPEQRLAALMGRARARLGAGDVDGALGDFSQASQTAPTSAEARLALADAYRLKSARGDEASFALALSAYDTALALIAARGPSGEQSRLLGRVYAGRGDLHLQRSRTLRAGDGADGPGAELDRARADFDQAIAADSQNGAALVGRAATFAPSAAGNQRALSDLDRAVRLSPADGAIYQARGDLYVRMGERESAMRDYDRALELGATQSYSVYIERGRLYLAAGDFQRADQNFAAAEALARQGQAFNGADGGAATAQALALRARATSSLIDAPGYDPSVLAMRARDLADEAARLQPDQARYHAGRCLARSVAGGEWNVAERACNEAIELARASGDQGALSQAYGAMGMLQLRWALSRAPSRAAETAHLEAAQTFFAEAVNAQGPSPAWGTGETALYRYAEGVALECLGRTLEANALQRAALDLDRSVEAAFLSHRIRHCRA